jgi:hypothetical protein
VDGEIEREEHQDRDERPEEPRLHRHRSP